MNKIDDFPNEFNRYQIEHEQVSKHMNDKINKTERMIQNELNHIEKQEIYCKELICDFNRHLSVRSCVYKNDRENKIIKIANHTRQCHDEAINFVHQNISDINSF